MIRVILTVFRKNPFKNISKTAKIVMKFFIVRGNAYVFRRIVRHLAIIFRGQKTIKSGQRDIASHCQTGQKLTTRQNMIAKYAKSIISKQCKTVFIIGNAPIKVFVQIPKMKNIRYHRAKPRQLSKKNSKKPVKIIIRCLEKVGPITNRMYADIANRMKFYVRTVRRSIIYRPVVMNRAARPEKKLSKKAKRKSVVSLTRWKVGTKTRRLVKFYRRRRTVTI